MPTLRTKDLPAKFRPAKKPMTEAQRILHRHNSQKLQQRFCDFWMQIMPRNAPAFDYIAYELLPRKWKFDIAFFNARVLVELHGLPRDHAGRHTTRMGFTEDRKKMLEATLAGYIVLELTPDLINRDVVGRIAELVRGRMR